MTRQPEPDSLELRNMQTMETLAKGFATRNVELILSMFADDAVFETASGPDPWGQRLVGHQQIRQAVERMFAWMPDMQLIDSRRTVSGDTGTADWTCIATTVKGQKIHARGCDLFQFRDGLVVRKDTYTKVVTRA